MAADFSLSVAKIQCPACSHSFVSSVPASVTPVSTETAFGTDLHRIYYSSAFRGAGVAMCSRCGFAWWLSSFRLLWLEERSELPAGGSREQLQKFARAYICGKQHKRNHLELGLLSLNASWCASDGGSDAQTWSETAREELQYALRLPSAAKDRGFYQYLLGELCRHEGDFESALKHFDLAVSGERLPESLINRQKVQARSGDSAKTLLPPYLVRELFCPVKSFNAA